MVSDLDSEESTVLKEFSWDVVDYYEQQILIQIDFESPEDLGLFFAEDFILITFYGVEFFKSMEDGIEVEFGY